MCLYVCVYVTTAPSVWTVGCACWSVCQTGWAFPLALSLTSGMMERAAVTPSDSSSSLTFSVSCRFPAWMGWAFSTYDQQLSNHEMWCHYQTCSVRGSDCVSAVCFAGSVVGPAVTFRIRPNSKNLTSADVAEKAGKVQPCSILNTSGFFLLEYTVYMQLKSSLYY